MSKTEETTSYEQLHQHETEYDAGSSDDTTFTAAEREWVLDSVLASQALEGIYISREVAARLLDEVMRELH